MATQQRKTGWASLRKNLLQAPTLALGILSPFAESGASNFVAKPFTAALAKAILCKPL